MFRRRLVLGGAAVIAVVMASLLPAQATATGQAGGGPGTGAEMGSSDWRTVSAGESHTCGIRTSGRLFCWGLDDFGQLGNGPMTGNQTTPMAVDATTTWASVSTGGWHTCARRTSGRAFCWGRDTWGQIGDGGIAADAQSPVEVSGARTDWRTVVAGYSHTCAIRTNRSLFCWGFDGQGMVGDGGANSDQQAPVQVVGNHTDWTQVSPGGQSTCGRRSSGRLYCWGDDDQGQLGNDPGLGDKPEPVEVSGNRTDWRSVSVGLYHACGLRTTGRLFCWGDDDDVQLGNDGVAADAATPVQVVGAATDWQRVSLGSAFTCARRTGSRLFCWGRNDVGQLGAGTFGPDVAVPVEVAGAATDWTMLDAGGFHACGRTTSRRLHCWGTNTTSQLGTLLIGLVMPWPVPVAR